MITTKGIIEDIVVDKNTKVVQYRIRIPMFHEIEGSSEISTKELPLAIYPLPPHMVFKLKYFSDALDIKINF